MVTCIDNDGNPVRLGSGQPKRHAEPTLTDWQASLIAAEKHGRQLTWGDGATVLYVLLMAVLGVVGAVVIMGVD